MAGFGVYLNAAKVVFSTSISDWVLQAGFALGVKLPDRVGGHDDSRNTTGGNQKGSGGSADDHGTNQANQWKRYKDDVESAFKKKYGVAFDAQHVKNALSGGAHSKEEDESEDEDYQPPKNIPKQDPAKSAKEKEKAVAQKIESKATKQELSEELVKLLKDSHQKEAFYKNPKSGPIANKVVELATEAKISGKDNKEKLDAIAAKFSNVKKAI